MSSPPPLPARRRFFEQAALFSVLAPFVVFLVGVFVQRHIRGHIPAMILIGVVQVGIVLAGLVLGIVALTRVGKTGRKGIFGRALAGTILNTVFLFLMGVLFLTNIRTAALKARGFRPEPRVEIFRGNPADKSEILKRVRAEAAEMLNKSPGEVVLSQPLSEQGADELDMVEIVMALEEAFGIRIPEEPLMEKEGNFRKDLTVEILADEVSRLLTSR
jgi:acyl carrier protein